MNRSVRFQPGSSTRNVSLAILAWLALGPASGVPLTAGPSTGGEFSLVGTVVGGGGQAIGGSFALEGTAGLPAAGASVGGDFAITGGLIGVYVVPGDIELTLTRTENDQVRLDWSAQAEGCVLEFTAQLGAETVWIPLNPAPAGNSLIVPFDAPARYYRLRKP